MNLVGNAYPNPEQEPTQEQLTSLNFLVEHHLEGVEAVPQWAMRYQSDGFRAFLRRESHCVYVDGSLQKRNVADAVTSSASDFMEQVTDQTTVEVDFLNADPNELGSHVSVRIADSGTIWPNLDVRNLGINANFSTRRDQAQIELIEDNLDNFRTTGYVLSQLADLLALAAIKNGIIEENEKIEQAFELLLTGVNADISSVTNDRAVEDLGLTNIVDELVEEAVAMVGRTEDDERPSGQAIADTFITVCSIKGIPAVEVSNNFSVEGFMVLVVRDVFNSGYLGDGVKGNVTIHVGDTILGEQEEIVFMEDGTYIYEAKSGIEFDGGRYQGRKDIAKRSATGADVGKFLDVLSRPKI